jgi:hypothetical protein
LEEGESARDLADATVGVVDRSRLAVDLFQMAIDSFFFKEAKCDRFLFAFIFLCTEGPSRHKLTQVCVRPVASPKWLFRAEDLPFFYF